MAGKKRIVFGRTKEGQISNIKWAYITNLKLRRGYASKDQYLVKALRVIVKGTRFAKYIKDIDDAVDFRQK